MRSKVCTDDSSVCAEKWGGRTAYLITDHKKKNWLCQNRVVLSVRKRSYSKYYEDWTDAVTANKKWIENSVAPRFPGESNCSRERVPR